MNNEQYELLKTFENLIKLSNTEEQVNFYHRQIASMLTPIFEISDDGLVRQMEKANDK